MVRSAMLSQVRNKRSRWFIIRSSDETVVHRESGRSCVAISTKTSLSTYLFRADSMYPFSNMKRASSQLPSISQHGFSFLQQIPERKPHGDLSRGLLCGSSGGASCTTRLRVVSWVDGKAAGTAEDAVGRPRSSCASARELTAASASSASRILFKACSELAPLPRMRRSMTNWFRAACSSSARLPLSSSSLANLHSALARTHRLHRGRWSSHCCHGNGTVLMVTWLGSKSYLSMPMLSYFLLLLLTS